MSHLSSTAPAQARASGRLQAPAQVRNSGRLQTSEFGSSGRLESEEAQASPEEPPRTPYAGRTANGARRRPRPQEHRSRKGKRTADEEESLRRKKILIPVAVIGLIAAVVLLAPALQMIDWQADAQTSISALTSFRSLPSKRPGRTVDQCVNDWLEDSRKSGDLTHVSGWSIKPIRFDKSKIILGFSFDEKSGVRTAEWLADVDNKTFTPKNDLAAQVY